MDEEELSYRTLRKIQQMEKNSPSFSSLPADYYDALVEYIKKLEERLESEASPQKQNILSDEIQNTKKIAVNIYEHREKKILLATISKSRGGNPDLKNLEDVEIKLFDSVLGLMKKSRESLLKKTSEQKPTENQQKNIEPPVEKQEEYYQPNTNPIIKITKDIPEFVGTDKKKYNLRKNDIISLPKNMSEMLIKRGVGKEVKP